MASGLLISGFAVAVISAVLVDLHRTR